MKRLWWEEFPGVLDAEYKGLQEADCVLKYKRDDAAWNAGVLRLDLAVKVPDGQNLRIQAVYPDLYPYFRVEVCAPDLDLKHHQNPFDKNLCLLGRSTSEWNVDDTLAWLLKEQLPKTLTSGQTDDATVAGSLEQHQAEPIAEFYPARPSAFVLVLSPLRLADGQRSGTFVIGTPHTDSPVVCGAMLEVRDEKRRIITRCDERLSRAWNVDHLEGRWVRLDTRPKLPSPPVLFGALFELLHSSDPNSELIRNCHFGGKRVQIRAAVFPQELRDWRRQEYGWVIVCREELRKK